MIAATMAAWQTRDESDCAAPAPPLPPHANPLRSGDVVRCPACGAEGEAWRWELDRPPRFQEWTVPVFRCRACRHCFGVKP